MVKVNGKIKAMLIDGKEIPEEQYPKYEKEFNAILEKIEKEHEKGEVKGEANNR
ncbi:hypothetical protein MUK70_02595 [Dyadobacter chenwenxiniae]|uniref:Uncharacterized protein n=1 Tax=Dyadobacter chenwenxiniae TaxID=2906456 RepID=A0A9X1PJ55_9BACT|nr:hypothetical protein [Dyadobacter chenwenxiniae]MCF0062362.1 hypothetical protein [Dyadobacter chenwenxiniae]UON83883.1 hypothetical protein MUK70_02595 [Dyadobacter chenwenxiniae]